VSQGDTTLAINNNLTFRMKRYPADFPGFDDKNLDPKGFIELDPDTTFCDNLVAVEDLMIDHAFKVYPNPVDQAITIEWDGMKYAQIEIYNLQGIKLSGQKCSGGRKFLDVSTLPNGIYFISIRTEDSFYSRKFVIQH
ncbi:MAG: T9SS type A sorting domain-containing protein, partial [Saprospiraceae bacterium]|nr:T9SS type A sorting domain-containing protein [Saprospiraceae bacterium]